MNKLGHVRAEVRRLSHVEAEVWILIEAEQTTATTEVRGRLVGPRCPGMSTVEVAYSLQRFPKLPEGLPTLSRRAIISDPSLWEPQRPFVYHAIIELWQDGVKCDQNEFEIGLSMRP